MYNFATMTDEELLEQYDIYASKIFVMLKLSDDEVANFTQIEAEMKKRNLNGSSRKGRDNPNSEV